MLTFACPAVAAPAPRAAPPEWPCRGCVVHVPARPADASRPLLVALHGDGGAVRPLARALQAACDEAGVILLAPRCPIELGCRSLSYWQWRLTSGHDERWLGGLVDAVAARHAVDPTRVYAAGYSGGATYLGWYAPRFPARFAAVAHVSGGAPWGVACPKCKVPVRFLIGATDPMIEPYVAPLRRYYEGCGGHEIAWQVLPGVSHESIVAELQAGRARGVLAWLLDHRAACAPDEGAMDAGALDAGAMDASAIDAGAIEAGATDAGVIDAALPAERAPPLPRVPPAAGCACAMGDPATGAGTIAAPLVVMIGALRRRRRDESARR